MLGGACCCFCSGGTGVCAGAGAGTGIHAADRAELLRARREPRPRTSSRRGLGSSKRLCSALETAASSSTCSVAGKGFYPKLGNVTRPAAASRSDRVRRAFIRDNQAFQRGRGGELPKTDAGGGLDAPEMDGGPRLRLEVVRRYDFSRGILSAPPPAIRFARITHYGLAQSDVRAPPASGRGGVVVRLTIL